MEGENWQGYKNSAGFLPLHLFSPPASPFLPPDGGYGTIDLLCFQLLHSIFTAGLMTFPAVPGTSQGLC